MPHKGTLVNDHNIFVLLAFLGITVLIGKAIGWFEGNRPMASRDYDRDPNSSAR